MKKLLPFLFLLAGCKKVLPTPEPVTRADDYIQFTIPAGGHYCDKSSIKQLSLTAMNFKVRFDSSAIYQTAIADNQYDINKLYGFSDGSDHHQNSARIGWSWNNAALRLYAYTYNNGIRDSKEIATLNIGDEAVCGINISGNEYIFKVNETTVSLPRASTGVTAEGYQLYPYFGGDEVAPHEIRIWIRDIQ